MSLAVEAHLRQLANQRPIFHSEADFQFALAWEIQRANPTARVRLEFPVEIETGMANLDIWDVVNGVPTAHEGRELAGTLAWAADTGGTMKGREAVHELVNIYPPLRWRPYSSIEGLIHGAFSYLLVKVESVTKAAENGASDG